MQERRNKAQIGMRGYARVLVAMQEPITRQALLATKVIGRTAIQRLEHALHEAGVIHIAGWVTGHRGPPLPLWVLGAGDDAPVPDGSRPHRRSQSAPGELLTRFLRLLVLLRQRHHPRSAAELAQAIGSDCIGVRKCIAVLHEARLVRIARWGRAYRAGRGRLRRAAAAAGAVLPRTATITTAQRKPGRYEVVPGTFVPAITQDWQARRQGAQP